MPIVSALLESDSAYFDCAAEIEDLGFAQLARMPGLSGLAAAGVVHRFDPDRSPKDIDAWVASIAARLREDGWAPRFYLQRPIPALEAALRSRGFRCQEEIAMVDDDLDQGDADAIFLEPVIDADGWERKRALQEACVTGPDGHPMAAAAWVELERRKVEAGGLMPFLVVEDGEDLGVVSTMDLGQMLRMKNLVVHTRFRGTGVATRAVRAVLGRARTEGRRAVGCFALAEADAGRLYRACGFREVARQSEWM